MKVYCRPTHIVDINIVFFVLDEDKLSIDRIPVAATMINSNVLNHLDGFKEVSPEEFTTLCLKHVSKENIEKFKYEYSQLFS